MRSKSILLVIYVLTLLVSVPVHGATYRLIDDRYLEIGNQCTYNFDISFTDPVAGPVSCSGTVDWEITGTENVSGYATTIEYNTYNISSCTPSVPSFSFTTRNNIFLTTDYLVEVRSESDEVVEIVWNNDPWEIIPVWISDTDTNRHVGHGEYQATLKISPYNTWYGYYDSYITFVGLEQITVAGGTFSCIIVDYKLEYHEDDGTWGYLEQRGWVHPIGVPIKGNGYEYYAPAGEAASDMTRNTELSWTNIAPSIGIDGATLDFGDTNGLETFEVWNDSMGTLNYNLSISEGGSYFSISGPSSGSSVSPADKATYMVIVNRENIPVGQTAAGKVMISSGDADNSPQYIDLLAENIPRLDSFDFGGFAALAFSWLRTGCDISNDWCIGNDLDESGEVNHFDLAIFCNHWLNDFSLVGHWPLDDNADNTFVSDISGNGHNGTASANTSLLSAPGQINTCFDFAGTDAVEISDDDALSFDDSDTNPFSITAWVYVTNTGNAQVILSKWNTGLANAVEWEFYLMGDAKFAFIAFDEANTEYAQVISDAALTTGWHFVAIVYDNADASWSAATAADYMALYVDGAAVVSTATTTVGYEHMRDTAAKVHIGCQASNGTDTTLFADKIDNVKIFSKCLTATEITALYSEGL